MNLRHIFHKQSMYLAAMVSLRIMMLRRMLHSFAASPLNETAHLTPETLVGSSSSIMLLYHTSEDDFQNPVSR